MRNTKLDVLKEQALSRVDLAELISETYPMDPERGGSYWRSAEHDSLVVDQRARRWYWNSRGESGDAIDWLRQYGGVGSFTEAIDYLLGGTNAQDAVRVAARRPKPKIVRNMLIDAEEYHQALLNNKGLILGLQRRRGLRLATILVARLGWHAGWCGWTLPHWRQGDIEYCTGIKVRFRGRGKLRRYGAIEGSQFELYWPPPMPDLDPTLVFITEGEWKALHMMQLGAYAVGCPASGFRPEWVPLLQSTFGQATFFAIRDNDMGGLTFLDKVRTAMPEALPMAPPFGYKGIDDWLSTITAKGHPSPGPTKVIEIGVTSV